MYELSLIRNKPGLFSGFPIDILIGINLIIHQVIIIVIRIYANLACIYLAY